MVSKAQQPALGFVDSRAARRRSDVSQGPDPTLGRNARDWALCAVVLAAALIALPGCSGIRSAPAVSAHDIQPIPGQITRYDSPLPSQAAVPYNAGPANLTRYASADMAHWQDVASRRSASRAFGGSCFG